MSRGMANLGIRIMSSHSFKSCETKVGEAIKKVTIKSMEDALHDEIQKSEKYKPDGHEELPALTLSVDMGWNKRSSGRRYNSLSGVLFSLGGENKKVVSMFVKVNQCHTCNKVKHLREKLEGASSTDGIQFSEIQSKIQSLLDHECVKNFEGYSKAMESHSIVELVKTAPENYAATLERSS